jgi:hypothetical protein
VPEIEATIKKVQKEEDTGWGTIETDHPQVKKLTTRISEKLSEAAAFKRSGERVSISYSEKARTVDTDAGPRTYRNYYYERAAVATNGAHADDGIDVIPSKKSTGNDGVEVISSTREEPASKRWSIALQGGGKLAVATLPLMPIEQRDFDTQKTIATAWAEFFFFTPPPERPTSGSNPQLAERSTSGAYSEPQGIEQPPAQTDDDIPW